ncbi:hypothetical protein C8R46DRAFT_1118137 [Mycena filopes]|nr:hypothetical protein C8R46DRAFT_1118137 [Mycena filopes]
MYTPIGKQRERSPSYRSITLEAEIPVVVLSNNSPATGTSVVHYLSPGARTPVLRGGADADAETPISFPIAQPTFTAEALANTSAAAPAVGNPPSPMNIMRILEWHAMNMTRPDPAQDYRGGSYAGLLWRKKLVAEERGLWPLPAEVDEGKSKLQEPFPVAH